MKRLTTNPHRPRRTRLSAALATALAGCIIAPHAGAFEIDTGNADTKVRWDTEVRYSVGVRGENVNPAFGNSPTYDETEYRFTKNKVMMNRLDLLTEFDAVYQNRFGARLSAAGWHDQAYHDRMAHTNPGFLVPGVLPYSAVGNYIDNRYSSTTDRFHYQGGELLDAFVFGNFDLAGRDANVKLGKHTVYWGEAFYTPFHGISYSQGPIDGLKAASSPGIEAKEVFLPVAQVSAAVQLSPEWSLRGQYFLDWKPNRLPEGGTYFGAADMLFSGPDRLFAGAAGFIPRGASAEPDKHTGNYGVNLRYTPHDHPDTTYGLYYRKFTETQPWAPVFRIAPPSPVPSDYHLAYAKGTQMVAGSVQTAVGPLSVGGELVYRKDTALNSNTAFVSSNFSVLDFAGVNGARGDTVHLVANAVYLLPRTALWEAGTLIGEVVYSRLLRVTQNADVYKGVGYLGCNDATAAATSGAKLVGDKNDGCSTRDVLLLNVGFTPQWLQVYPGVDLSAPISFGIGLHGNGATLAGGNEGAWNYSVGLQADVRQKYTFAIKWSDSYARYNTGPNGMVTTSNGNAVQNNHGWLNVSFKTTF